jgi:ATP-binding cassette subfamily B protein
MAKRNRYYEDEKTRKIDKKAIRRALRFAIPYKKLIIKIFIAMFIMSFISMLPTRILAIIVDNVITAKGMDIFGVKFDWIALTFMMVGAYAIAEGSNAVFSYFRTVLMSKVGHGVVHDMRHAVYERLQQLAFDYYDSRPNGKILVRATTYLDELATVYSSGVVSIIVDVFKIIFIVVWLMLVDFILALVIIASVFPMVILLAAIRTAVARRRRKYREKNSNRTAYIAESIQGQLVTNAFNRKDKNMEIFKNLDDQRRKAWARIFRVNELTMPVMTGMFRLGITIVYWVAFLLITNGMSAITPGLLVSFISYSSMLPMPLNNISSQLQECQGFIFVKTAK